MTHKKWERFIIKDTLFIICAIASSQFSPLACGQNKASDIYISAYKENFKHRLYGGKKHQTGKADVIWVCVRVSLS